MLSANSRSRAWVEVDLTAIRFNVSEIARFIGQHAHIMSVVKADAYGHGLTRVAHEVIKAGASWLGVAAVSEGALLRDAGISSPIALLSAPAAAAAADIVHYGLTAMVGDAAMLDALHAVRSLSQSELAVHLDIETGMGRSGALPQDAVSLWKHARSLGILVEGISTHFADADNANDCHTRRQLQEFEKACAALYSAGASFKWIHIDNSASIIAHPITNHNDEQRASSVLPAPSCRMSSNLIRPGLLIYGLAPKSAIATAIHVRPALALKARIATIRELPKNHAISYGVTHRLQRNSRVATISIGYGDGYPRALSNCGFILICGSRAPILGRVCMDQTIVDVTDIPKASAGDEVICIGSQNNETIKVEQISGLIGATEHEITTGLTARLPRVYWE
jgi:alanine racemase